MLEHSCTACFYFISPLGPTALDLVVMSALSQMVPLLPVIGKADTLTSTQAKELQLRIQELIERPDQMVPALKPGSIRLALRSEL